MVIKSLNCRGSDRWLGRAIFGRLCSKHVGQCMSFNPSMAYIGQPWSRKTFPNKVTLGCPKLECIRINCCRCSLLSRINFGPCWVLETRDCFSTDGSRLWELWELLGSASAIFLSSQGLIRGRLVACGSSENCWSVSLGATFGSVDRWAAKTVMISLAGGDFLINCFLVRWVQSSHCSSQNTDALVLLIPMVIRRGACDFWTSGGGARNRSAPLQASITWICLSGNFMAIKSKTGPERNNLFPTWGACGMTSWIIFCTCCSFWTRRSASVGGRFSLIFCPLGSGSLELLVRALSPAGAGSSRRSLHCMHRKTFWAKVLVYSSVNWDRLTRPTSGKTTWPATGTWTWSCWHRSLSSCSFMMYDVVKTWVPFWRNSWEIGCLSRPAVHISHRARQVCWRIAASSSWNIMWDPTGCSRCAWLLLLLQVWNWNKASHKRRWTTSFSRAWRILWASSGLLLMLYVFHRHHARRLSDNHMFLGRSSSIRSYSLQRPSHVAKSPSLKPCLLALIPNCWAVLVRELSWLQYTSSRSVAFWASLSGWWSAPRLPRWFHISLATQFWERLRKMFSPTSYPISLSPIGSQILWVSSPCNMV